MPPPVPADRAAIAGVVRSVSGKPLSWAVVSFEGGSPEHRDIGAVTDDAGRFRFDELTPGTYTVLVNAEGYPPQRREVEAPPGRLAEVDVTLTS